MKIVGVEGSWPLETPATLGAAVLKNKRTVTNGVSGFSEPSDRLQELSESGDITLFKSAAQLNEFDQSAGALFVIAVRTDFPANDVFRLPSEARDLTLTIRFGKRHEGVNILQGRKELDQAREIVARQVFERLIRGDETDELKILLLRGGLAVRHNDPYLLAYKCSLDSSLPVERVARRCADRDRDTFRAHYRALTSSNSYRIKYDGGVAEYGGLELDVASKQLRAMKLLKSGVTPDVVDVVPFRVKREEMPEVRLYGLKAASATLDFAGHVEGEALLQRYLRHFVLSEIEARIDGEETRYDDQRLDDAVHQIVQPTKDTRFRHGGLATADELREPAKGLPQEHEWQRSASIKLAGLVNGIFGDFSRLELRLGPGWIEAVSARDVAGVEHIEGRKDPLHSPLIIDGDLEHGPGNRYRINLRAVAYARTGVPRHVDYLVSGLIPGYFVKTRLTLHLQEDGRLSFRREDGTVALDVPKVPSSKAESEDWMRVLARDVSLLELSSVDDVEWLRVKRRRLPSFFGLIYSMLKLQTPVSTRDWLRQASRDRGIRVVLSNLRREARNHDRWFRELNDEPEEHWILTDEGVELGRVLENAGVFAQFDQELDRQT